MGVQGNATNRAKVKFVVFAIVGWNNPFVSVVVTGLKVIRFDQLDFLLTSEFICSVSGQQNMLGLCHNPSRK